MACAALFCTPAAQAQDQPNIVLVFLDNFGWGELGVYGGGILRGAETPRIDRLASQGLRLLNFNVEAQCTPSRASILTGRYAIRTGNASIPIETPVYGLTQWEVTIPEILSEDFQHGRHYGSVRVVDPFLVAADEIHELPPMYESEGT